MPAPTNISAATAIDIPNVFPYEVTQDVHFGGTTYTVWYKLTPITTGIYNIFGWGGEDFVYQTETIVYGPDSDTDVYLYLEYVWDTAIRVPLTGGSTYYFQFNPWPVDISPANLTVKVNLFEEQLYPDYSFAIPDDAPGFPLVVISPTTGEVLAHHQPFPSGEFGETLLANGRFLVEERFVDFLRLYLPDRTLLTSVPWVTTGSQHPLIRANNNSNKWYVASTSSGTMIVRTVDVDGNLGSTWNITVSFHPRIIAVSPNDLYLYYPIPSSGGSGGIWRYNLGSSSSDGVFIPFLLGYAVFDILVLPNGDLLITYSKGGIPELFVKRFDSAGTYIQTYDFTSGYNGLAPEHIFFDSYDGLSFWMWSHEGSSNPITGTFGGISRWRKIQVSDGAILANFTTPEYETGVWVGESSSDPPLWGISQSCPVWVLTEGTLTPTGTIVVNKVQTDGDAQDFDFTTTGGLTPSTFSLGDGDSQSFTDLVPGTYGIIETADPSFDTTYLVSNGDPASAIEIEGDETVTVVVTNTLVPPPETIAGIYKVVPNKRQDTLWVDFDPEETLDVKIPDPYFQLALFGK